MEISKHPGGLIVRVPGNIYGGVLLVSLGLVMGWVFFEDFGNSSSTRLAIGEVITLGLILGGIWIALPTTIVVGAREGVFQVRRGLSTVYFKRDHLLSDIQKTMAESATGKLAIIFTSKPMKKIVTIKPASDTQEAARQINEVIRNAWLKQRDTKPDQKAEITKRELARHERKAAKKKAPSKAEQQARRLPD